MKISKKVFDKLNSYLESGETIRELNLDCHSILFSENETVEDGYSINLEVYTGEESVMASVYLQNENGEYLAHIESDDCLKSEYSFKNEETQKEYSIKIQFTEECISENIVNEIIKDLTDRRGINNEWFSIDEDIQEEIKETWKNIIFKNIIKDEEK